jgi:hypothetical protein
MVFSLAKEGSTGRMHAIEVSEHAAIIVAGMMGNLGRRFLITGADRAYRGVV